jgi:ATP-dependent DNA helicase RecG
LHRLRTSYPTQSDPDHPYSNRIETLNPGYSLKDMVSLGTLGSRLRNPAIAAVLHELNWAETKGSGICTMRRMAGEAGLPLPEFASDRRRTNSRSRCSCITC